MRKICVDCFFFFLQNHHKGIFLHLFLSLDLFPAPHEIYWFSVQHNSNKDGSYFDI